MVESPLNAVNRTVYISDNLPFLKSLNDRSVDLVCIDPPFGKKQTFTGNVIPPLTQEEQRIERELMDSWGVYDADTAYEAGLEYPDQTGTTANFRDIWKFERLFSEGWMEDLESKFPAGYWLIQATRYSHGEQTAAYIGYMLERLVEIKRVLKDTGSVYLHCDHEANAYLRQLMDAVFGARNFRNEIKWVRHTSQQRGSQHDPKKYADTVDTILFYAKSAQTGVEARMSLTEDEQSKKFNLVDESGRKFYDDSSHIWRTPNMGARPNLCYEWRGYKNPHPSGWRLSKERLEEEYQKGNIVILPNGKLQRRKYEGDFQGATRSSLWDDIQPAAGKERTGYPTQKPQALAERIVKASCPEGGTVLDCFAGCAYVPVAAELLGRSWIACDMSPRAWTIVRRQFHKQSDLHIRTEGELAASDGEGLQFQLGDTRIIRVRGPNQLPQRDTPTQSTFSTRTLPAIKYKQKPLETSQEIWNAFVEQYGPECWYCGQQKNADRRELHLDHVEPNRRDGTNDDCWNRVLACSPCNNDKSNNLDLDKVFSKALADGRISSKAKLDEIRRNFDERRQWARKRWENLPKQPKLQELPTDGSLDIQSDQQVQKHLA